MIWNDSICYKNWDISLKIIELLPGKIL